MVRDKSPSSIILDVIIHTSLIILLIVTILPILHVAAISFSSSTAINRGLVTFYPKGFNLNAYIKVWEAGTVPNAFKNSVIYTVVGTAINMVLTITTAYPLSKKDLPFKKFYTTLIVITMFFGGGLIPRFLLVTKLGLYNTMWALILPGAISSWNLIVMRTFFQSIPVEIEESAYLDGANDMQILFRIILPLSQASLATIGLFYAVGHWNSWFSALIYLKSNSKYPLQLVLREIVIQGQMAKELAEQGDTFLWQEMEMVSVESLKYATLFISIVPMLIVYPFIQKYFVKGVMIGSLKG